MFGTGRELCEQGAVISIIVQDGLFLSTYLFRFLLLFCSHAA